MQLFGKHKLFFFVALPLLCILNSCKEPENVGLEVIPQSDLSSLNFTDTFSLQTSVSREDSLPASANSINLLGEINDNSFGNSKAGFYTQALLSSANVSFGSNPVCDSMILTLDYSGYYGDLSSTHNFKVYRLDESISLDTNLYYSNKSFNVFPTVIGELTTSVHPDDSVLINGVNTSPHLRIPLDTLLERSFFDANASVFTDNNSFLNFFKGIYITDTISGGNGSILYFGLTKNMSKITMYYDSTSRYEFLLNGTGRVNHFEHDYSTAVFANNFNDPVFGSNFCYVQSMAGVKTKTTFPFLKNILTYGNISVNKAELVISIDNSTTAAYPAHNSLFLTGIDSTGKSYFLPDFIDSPTSFGGTIASGTCSFLVTRYIQQILSGSRNDYGLFIVATGASVNANRTIIGGSHNPNLRMKLKLNYTQLNP